MSTTKLASITVKLIPCYLFCRYKHSVRHAPSTRCTDNPRQDSHPPSLFGPAFEDEPFTSSHQLLGIGESLTRTHGKFNPHPFAAPIAHLILIG